LSGRPLPRCGGGERGCGAERRQWRMQRGGAPVAVEKIEQASSAKIFSGTARRWGQMRLRLPLERICAQYGFRFFFPEKSKFVASTAKRQRGLQRGKPGSPLPCFASFCRSKRKAPAASGANYAFAKGCVTPTGEIKLLPFAGNPSVSLAADSLSLRLGHGAALICHRHIIHYRAATSLPLTQGSLWCRAMPLRYPLRGGGCGAVRGAGDERAQSKKIPRPLLDGGKMFFVTWRCSGCRGGYP
jgi:hypothetical protein